MENAAVAQNIEQMLETPKHSINVLKTIISCADFLMTKQKEASNFVAREVKVDDASATKKEENECHSDYIYK